MRYSLLLLPLTLLAQPTPDQGRLLLESIHKGDLAAIRAALRAGADANTRDELGDTALMHAAAYAPIDAMKTLIGAGADVNAASDAGFTALMWSVHDTSKLRLLLSKGAGVNARSKDGNTAMILARQNGIAEAVPILLRAGAKDEDGMTAVSRPALAMERDLILQQLGVGIEPMQDPGVRDSPLVFVTFLKGGPVEPLRAMLDAGASAEAPIQFATLSLPPISFAASQRNVEQVRELLKRDANPNARGSRGLTPLMVAASAELQDVEIIRMLIAKGADVNALDESGRGVLDWALLQGETDAAREIRAAGGKPSAKFVAPQPIENPRTPAAAVEKAVALLQPIGPNFFRGNGRCISCHNNSLPGLAARAAADRKIAVDTGLIGHAEKTAIATWSPMRENFAVGATSVGGLVANVSYEMFAMAEAGYPRNFTTDAAALALLRLQHSNGDWGISDCRPPLGGGDLKWAALVSRSLIAYLPPGLHAERDRAVARARDYLLRTTPRTTQDAAFRLLGLIWTSAPPTAIGEARSKLIALQSEDGGWAQLATMSSDAYATGQALFALTSAGIAPGDATYRRGADYLLRTQLPDGSWFVQSRAIGFQPYRETGFPHGRSQFISAAATSWAVLALVPAADTPKQVAVIR